MSAPGSILSATRPDIQKNAIRFVKEWTGETRERAEKDSYWSEFLAIYGLKRRRYATFEYLAKRQSTGRHGFIDLFAPGELLVEHKSAGENLDKALDQAFDYLVGMPQDDQPHTIVVCDFERFLVHDLETGTQTRFPLEDLPKYTHLFEFLAGYDKRGVQESEEEASLKATGLLSELHDALKTNKYNDHALRVLLVRLLYLLYADDTGIFQRGLFHDWLVVETREDGSDLGAKLIELFGVLDTKPEDRETNLSATLSEFTYINGSLFEETIRPPHMDEKMRDLLIDACRFEWSKISPALFGSLFQNTMQPKERRQLGAHYTSERDIMRLIQPLFLDDLEGRLERSKAVPESSKRLTALREFRDFLPTLKFLDAAAGTGNFLLIAYRELRRVELECLVAIRETEDALQTRRGKSGKTALPGVGQMAFDVSWESGVTVDQFYGIELDEFAAMIARTTIHLVDHLANLALSEAFGDYYVRLPLQDSAHIRDGNALQIDWSEVLPADECSYILGNPPFAGQYTRTGEQTDDLKGVWGEFYNGYMDYVSGWYVKAAQYIGDRDTRVALVSTNSICQGEAVPAIWEPMLNAGFHIDFAHRTFLWTSEARGKAGVHVVIVGFSRGRKPGTKPLFEYGLGGRGEPLRIEASNINAYLADGPDVFVRPRTSPLSTLLPPVIYGSKPADGGFLSVSPEEYPDIAADAHAAKYLRPFIGARELIHSTERWCLWMNEYDPADVRASAILRERLEGVKKFRGDSKKKQTREGAKTPALFAEVRQPSTDYLGIPIHVGESRRFFPVQRFTAEVVTSNANFIAADPDGMVFAAMSSSMFITWMRGVAGRIRADLRLSGTGVWNTFPLPDLDQKTRQAMIDAGQDILKVRSKYVGSSLADMYDPLAMPADLVKAHDVLDRIVDKAIGGRKKIETDADRLSVLFERYVQLEQAGQLALGLTKKPKRRRKAQTTA
ncbi:class I SAM-dependent DNA methyltransferase [Cellulomonas sp. APG4]|uniref:class I SAM-dependent DNA methyltransferase n=1 Tax=Cellulomonas sp. APG4 TaxID=1538656 RepID=UPI00137B4131|nr:class I SAM-dependent DNA methyltransferase [Cellulomonas sp. APG4]NCT90390.1 class I SAM-dependent DNA methyltransferase [Cellulomonas sp. APG4]